MKVLLTGMAGFIGFHLAEKLFQHGYEIIGIDNINDYYDLSIKYGRLNELGIEKRKIKYGKKIESKKFDTISFIKCDLNDRKSIKKIFNAYAFDVVCNMASQAGVRYSIENPYAYTESNITGFLNILEGCRSQKIKHLVYASSSSVYGLNETMPFSTKHNVDHPVSLYAATKKSNELMAHTYSYLYNIPSTGLRFFTVYGPWGRPDMALYIFTKAINECRPIEVYNHGNMKRDFTYIDDIVKGIIHVIKKPPTSNNAWSGKNPDPSNSVAPYKLYNIGNNNPENLMDFIKAIEDALGKNAEINFQPLQPGDVVETFADVSGLKSDFGYKPSMSMAEGVRRFVNWYREFYKV